MSQPSSLSSAEGEQTVGKGGLREVAHAVVEGAGGHAVAAEAVGAACAGSPYPRDLGSRSGRGLGGGMATSLADSR